MLLYANHNLRGSRQVSLKVKTIKTLGENTEYFQNLKWGIFSRKNAENKIISIVINWAS